jgi:DNA-binding NarL/FixJ family response regulator
MDVVAEAGTVDKTVQKTEKYLPNVVVMDLGMPGVAAWMQAVKSSQIKLIGQFSPPTHCEIFRSSGRAWAALQHGGWSRYPSLVGLDNRVH